MKKEIDYRNLYHNHYKNIPNVCFWATLIFLCIGAIIPGVIIFTVVSLFATHLFGIAVILLGFLAAFAIAYLVRFFVAVSISQKIIVADTLLSMKEGNRETDKEEISRPVQKNVKNERAEAVEEFPIWPNDDIGWGFTEDNVGEVTGGETENIYKMAFELARSGDVKDVEKAIELFESIQNTQNVTNEIAFCYKKADRFYAEMQQKEKSRRRKIKISAISIGLSIVLLMISCFVVYPFASVLGGKYYVYVNLYNAEEYTVPEGVDAIDGWAFEECDSLVSVTIPEGVESIGDWAFKRCENLTTVTLPADVTKINKYAFYDCSNLITINFEGTISQWKAIEKGSHWDYGTGNYTVYCSNGKVSK